MAAPRLAPKGSFAACSAVQCSAVQCTSSAFAGPVPPSPHHRVRRIFAPPRRSKTIKPQNRNSVEHKQWLHTVRSKGTGSPAPPAMSIHPQIPSGPDPFMPCSPLGCHSAALGQHHTPVGRHHLLHETSLVSGSLRAREQTHGPMALQINSQSVFNLRKWINDYSMTATHTPTHPLPSSLFS